MYTQNLAGDWVKCSEEEGRIVMATAGNIYLLTSFHPDLEVARIHFLLKTIFKENISGLLLMRWNSNLNPVVVMFPVTPAIEVFDEKSSAEQIEKFKSFEQKVFFGF